VVFLFMLVRGSGPQLAEEAVALAAGAFQLYRGMADVIAFLQYLLYLGQQQTGY